MAIVEEGRSSFRPTSTRPVKYTVKTKDTWEKIARKFLSHQDDQAAATALARRLARENRNVRGLVAGTVIRVPKVSTTPTTPVPAGYTGTSAWPDRPWAQPAPEGWSQPRYAQGQPHTLPTLPKPGYQFAPGTPHTLPDRTPTTLEEAARIFQGATYGGRTEPQAVSPQDTQREALRRQYTGETRQYVKPPPEAITPARPRFRGPGFRERERPSDFSTELVPHEFSVAASAFAEGRYPLMIYDWDLDYLMRSGMEISEEILLGMGYWQSPFTGNWILRSGVPPSGLGQPTSGGYSSGWGGLGSSVSYGGRRGGGGGGYTYPTYTGASDVYARQGGRETDTGRMLRSTSLGTLSWRI